MGPGRGIEDDSISCGGYSSTWMLCLSPISFEDGRVLLQDQGLQLLTLEHQPRYDITRLVLILLKTDGHLSRHV
jgi:hypothetical protein